MDIGLNAVIGFIGILIGIRIGINRVYVKLNKAAGDESSARYNSSIIAINMGRLDEAIEEIDRLINEVEMTSVFRPDYYLANSTAYYYRGDYQQANKCLIKAIEKNSPDGVRSSLLSELSIIQSLSGNIQEAKSTIEIMENLFTKEQSGFELRPKAILALKKEQFSEIYNLLEKNWLKITTLEGNREIEELRVIWAYSLYKITGVEQESRRDRINELLGGVKPVRPFGFICLWKDIPELQRFLAEYGIN